MRNTYSFPRIIVFLSLLCVVPVPVFSADDNILAHELYQQGKYAQAAEIFTDPAWKGVSLYRSAQWWRAAEAFVRANDAVSQYNLGNCYVQLGYYELALEAYMRALSIDPELSDARHNAEIMRQLLARQSDEESGQQALQSRQEAIDSIESESDERSGNAGSGEEQTIPGDNKTGNEEESSTAMQSSADAKDESEGGNVSDQSTEQQSGKPGADNVKGMTSDDNDIQERPSGGSETDSATQESQSAGVRTRLEHEQATEQWLNQINHDPNRFLQSRIQLEAERRQAAGQSAPDGGNAW